MFGITGIGLYVIIFLGKLIELAVGTVRIAFVSKGKKLLAGLFGFFEVTFWVIIASSVITDIKSDPFKVVVYCAGFACGVMLGMWLEQKMAVGLTSIQAVTLAKDGEKIGAALREQGFGVTILDGHSVDGTKRELIFVQVRSRLVPEAMRIVQGVSPDAVISVSDVKRVRGGFLK